MRSTVEPMLISLVRCTVVLIRPNKPSQLQKIKQTWILSLELKCERDLPLNLSSATAISAAVDIILSTCGRYVAMFLASAQWPDQNSAPLCICSTAMQSFTTMASRSNVRSSIQQSFQI